MQGMRSVNTKLLTFQFSVASTRTIYNCSALGELSPYVQLNTKAEVTLLQFHNSDMYGIQHSVFSFVLVEIKSAYRIFGNGYYKHCFYFMIFNGGYIIKTIRKSVNSFPFQIRNSPSVPSFRKHLKTHLFKSSFPT